MTLIETFLDEWLGRWPPRSDRDVVGSSYRAEPGWDGALHPVWGVADGDGRWVVSVTPDRAARPDPLDGFELFDGTFRFSESPDRELEPLGEWVPHDHPAVPAWLQPFGHDVLVVLDEGSYVAGVGLKRHLPTGWEISVGTEPEARGRGYARRLTATAARYILDHGAVALYLHADDNVASAKAAVAAGFPDLGWRVLSVKGDET
jgi:GNAT superfamily N-acetyltransferase